MIGPRPMMIHMVRKKKGEKGKEIGVALGVRTCKCLEWGPESTISVGERNQRHSTKGLIQRQRNLASCLSSTLFWRMDKKKVAVPLVCHGHSRPVVDLFYSPVTPDGFFLISASKDSSPMLRNGETGDWIGTFEGHKGAVWSCCLDTNALRAATASADFSTKVWDALTGDELHSFEHKHIVRACAFSEDTHLLLTGGVEKILRIYDMNRPDAPPREVDKSPGSVRTVAWLHSDQTILSSCTDMGGVRLWDVRSGKIVQTLETKSSVTSAEVSQDGRYITTADGSTVKFWDANYYGLVKSYDMPCTVESVSLEPKYGNKFVAGGEDMWVHVFDFHTGNEIACNKGHHGPVHCVRFSPGGESYASGSEDGTIRIWQTGPLTLDDSETLSANGSIDKVKVTADEVSRKIEGFHVADEGKSKEKDEAVEESN
ncbi:unnamed protein product [Sphenostylis stenocarpa]|uniref:Serine-threonine kinase receptor-associated protein n=1 Tax=Sphenostylis stenocarpa TaxID=92480 RepID=A0AA86VEG1_9FABA|nr:unnamed protein product [Sphenostylis stenocarpa]